MRVIPFTELILNSDGSIYHLALLPEQLAENIIIVGDPARVKMVSDYFDFIDYKVPNREFITHSGIFNGKRISVVSTGIGTDNIDIFMNEADALVNIDLKTRKVKSKKTTLNIVRIGTSGALQKDIEVNSFVASEYGLGLDGLLHYYDELKKIDEKEISEKFASHIKWKESLPFPYTVKASEILLKRIGQGMKKGITVTAPGFYAPQGRNLRLTSSVKDIEKHLSSFRFVSKSDYLKQNREVRIVNLEMETSAFYGLARHLGHHACTVCVAVGNRITKRFSDNYHSAMKLLIRTTLERLTSVC